MNSEEPSADQHVPNSSSRSGNDKSSDKESPLLRIKGTERLLAAQIANSRRARRITGFLGILFVAQIGFFAAGCWWYYQQCEPKLHQPAQPSAPLAKLPEQTVPPAKDSISSTRIDDLQKQLADISKKILAADERADHNLRLLSELAARTAEIANARPEPARPSSTVQERSAEEQSPTESELVLLKERNRLTAYADEAVATGARGPYERLWDSLDDPRLANLAHAARSEILRVQSCFLSGQRVKFYGIQQYQIPVAEIFPGSAALAPAQLSDDQFITILQNHDLDWQARVKAAWYLGQRRSTNSAEALVNAIKSDPVLDVVAEATFSFEQITGYHARLFEVQPLLAWWSVYNMAPAKAPEADPTK